MGPSGLTLYIDGKRVGSNGGTSTAQPYAGYWRVGGDSPWSGNAYFAGDIDDVAIYPTTVSLSTVQSHYTASGRTVSGPTRPTDAYGQAVWDANPDLYWRLDDTNGTAKDSSPNESNGTYQGGYTQGQAGRVRRGDQQGGRLQRQRRVRGFEYACTTTRRTTRSRRGSRPRPTRAERSSGSAARRPGPPAATTATST